jgi:cellulose synthase/poly-beta-1,6-N-acetylglucosamine synthase-like glycosyltransferase
VITTLNLQIDLHIIIPYLFYAFCAVTAVQLIYFWGIFARFAFYRKKQKNSEPQPVSVVICAKNEYHNLKDNLPPILNQNYPDFEVVVVNDASDDETIFLLQDMEREYKHLKVVNITQDLNFFKGKKFPLSLGIKSAKNELLLLTDADCVPSSPNWIMEMMGNFDSKTEIVLGYGPYEKKNNLLNMIIRYETIMTTIQYFSYALAGMPYMGVGRNLAYRKSLFMKNKGFISHYTIKSGDDDLFINKVATGKNTKIEIIPESHTESPAKNIFRDWWYQKRRHLSTGKYYKPKHKFMLGFYSASLILFYLLFVALLILKFYVYIVLSLFAVRLISKMIIFKKSMQKLNEKKLLLISPLFELFLLGFIPLIMLANLVIKQSKWK